jgi:hypothetical protein
MTSVCRQHELELLSSGGDPAAPGEELRRHLAECAACTSLSQRLACEASLLRSLTREPAPAQLDGLVVASLHGGHREERVASALGNLTRTRVPRELERALSDRSLDPLAAGVDPVVPAVLERLVSEDLRDPSKALSRRFAGRLPRLRAPEELAARVAATLSESAAPPRRRWAAMPLALALLTVLAAGFVWQLLGGEADAPTPTYRFAVRYVESADALGPEARSLLAGLSGGASELHGLLGRPYGEEAR